jgi:uncharacterized membrane protein
MFQFLFKYPAAVFSKGKLVLLGPWPSWVLILSIGALVCILGWTTWRKHGRFLKALTNPRALVLWLLQSATVAILLLLLWQPAISVTALRPQQNIVAVVVDDSASMSLADDGAAREQQAIQLLQSKLLPQLSAKYQVRLYRLDAGISRIADVSQLQANGAATQIGEGLRQLTQETATLPIGAVVLLSDGSDNSGGIDLATLNDLRSRRLPVNAIGFGRDQLSHDIELDGFVVAQKVLPNSRVEAQARLRQNGFTGSHAQLTILADGNPVANREIVLTANPEQVESIEFNAGKAGVRRLEARIDPLAGEENLKNNTQTRVLAVDGAKRRLLYVEGEPRWEYKFLRRAVEDDPAVEIVSMLRTTQNKIYRQGISNPSELEDGFPSKPEDLFAYQGLILGSVESGFFTPAQQRAIHDFVDRRGGGLLFLGGRAALADGDYNAPPFSELLPVALPNRKGTFHRQMVAAELTDAGRKSLICRIEESPEDSLNHWNILPYLADYQDPGTVKPGAVELARVTLGGNHYPLLVTENYGRGRTAVFATGGSWRWRMQQPVSDTSQQTFWRQLIRWTAGATPSPVVASASELRLEDSGKLELRAEVRDKSYNPIGDAAVQANIVTPSGSTRTVVLHPDASALGIYTGNFDADQAGSYIAEVKANQGITNLGSDLVAFQRENGMAENFHRQQNRELLEKLAQGTGGSYYTPEEAKHLPDEISFSESGISARETMDLWNMPVVFILLLMLRSSEWLLRRRWGLV